MKNNLQPSEHNDRRTKQLEALNQAISSTEEQVLLDYLIDNGFVVEEAMKLVHMREHLYANDEMRQRMADDAHMQFARWLYEQGTFSEE